MPKYTVGKKSLLHGGALFKEGDTIELPDELAESHGLLAAGRKNPDPNVPPKDPKTAGKK